MTSTRVLVAALVVGLAATAVVLVGAGGGSRAPSDDSELAARRWEVTSGDWTLDDGQASTGAPVFRARTTTRDHGDVAVSLRFRIDGFGPTGAGRATHAWDGVHVGLRYATPDDLYYVSVARRDGTVAIKRKTGGEYETLDTGHLDVAVGEWHTARVEAYSVAGGAVTITLSIDGTPVLAVTDDDPAALTAAGRVSIRSDEVTATFAGVTIEER